MGSFATRVWPRCERRYAPASAASDRAWYDEILPLNRTARQRSPQARTKTFPVRVPRHRPGRPRRLTSGICAGSTSSSRSRLSLVPQRVPSYRPASQLAPRRRQSRHSRLSLHGHREVSRYRCPPNPCSRRRQRGSRAPLPLAKRWRSRATTSGWWRTAPSVTISGFVGDAAWARAVGCS